MSASSQLNAHDAIRDSILIGIHQKNFRDGAFANLISKNTPVVEALNILAASPRLSSSEKVDVRSLRDAFVAFQARVPAGQAANIFDMMPLMGPMEKLTNMFDGDARGQGIYVPPSMIQVMNEDGSIKESIVVNEDGTGTTTAGGVPGVPPGAPEESPSGRQRTPSYSRVQKSSL